VLAAAGEENYSAGLLDAESGWCWYINYYVKGSLYEYYSQNNTLLLVRRRRKK